MYTYAQLKRCKKKVLLELVRYHGFGKLPYRTKKNDIIDHILEGIHNDMHGESVNELVLRRMTLLITF
jgi:hypothetical protein